MVQSVADPQPELCPREERILLSKHVELRVAVKDSCGDELVENTDDKGRKDGEEDIVQRERPRLVGNLPREVVEEGILSYLNQRQNDSRLSEAYPELRHVQYNVLVERVYKDGYK